MQGSGSGRPQPGPGTVASTEGWPPLGVRGYHAARPLASPIPVLCVSLETIAAVAEGLKRSRFAADTRCDTWRPMSTSLGMVGLARYLRRMAESAPATAEPSDAATAPPETAADASRPRWFRRHRVPTSVVVTVLLALFSVWIGPALTRQWDDRQEERELKAEIIDDVTTRSAQIIGKTVAASETTKSMRGLETEWDVFRYRTEAKLLAYFPVEVARQWAEAADLVTSWISFADFGRDDPSGEAGGRRELIKSLGQEGEWFDDPGECIHTCAVSELTLPLRQRLSAFTAVLLSANSDAFSTTRRDLIRDLLPSIRTASRDPVDEKVSRRLGYRVSSCTPSEDPEGTLYECDVDYSVERIYVEIDQEGNVYPP